MKLSRSQEDAVSQLEGPLLVEAGPGSGKTRVLVERVKRLLRANDDNRVLALTFSNLAAREMRDRLGEDPDLDQLSSHADIGTIHAYCLRLVEQHGKLAGLDAGFSLLESEDEKREVLRAVFDSDQLLQKMVAKIRRGGMPLSDVSREISSLKRAFAEEGSATEAVLLEAREAYDNRLRRLNLIDYDDILLFAHEILTSYPAVRALEVGYYSHICVDEAQDLNSAQYAILRDICGPEFRNVMLVGDKNQSIYGFNGSDSRFMAADFVRDFKPRIIELRENFRSAGSIIRFANTLQDSGSVATYAYQGEVRIEGYPDEDAEARAVASLTSSVLRNGHPEIEDRVSMGDIAVIARNRYALSGAEEALIGAGMPVIGGAPGAGMEFESDTMKILDLSIRSQANERDVLHRGRLLEVLAGNSCAPSDPGSPITEILRSGPYRCLVPLVAQALSDRPNFDSIVCGIRDVVRDLPDASAEEGEEKYLASRDVQLFEAHVEEYCGTTRPEFRDYASFRRAVSLGLTSKRPTEEGISALTVHMSKGLQFKLVFIVGVAEGTFPDYRAVRAGGRQLGEEKNEMFVAVTRAKRVCVISYPRSKKMPWGGVREQRPSRFIKDAIARG